MVSLASRGGDQAGYLYPVRVWMCSGVRPEGWLRWLAYPFCGNVECGYMHKTLFLLSRHYFFSYHLQKWQLGFWSFCIVPNLSQLLMYTVIFSLS